MFQKKREKKSARDTACERDSECTKERKIPISLLNDDESNFLYSNKRIK